VDNCVFLHFPAVFLGCQFGQLTRLLLRLWQVSNGCQMKPSATALAPNIEVADHNADNVNLFTLIMTDPDAPSPSEPSMREWVHWYVPSSLKPHNDQT
jgi:hypothetical protein